MSDLRGEYCHVCQQKIEIAASAQRCSTCGKPVHQHCMEPAALAINPENLCPRCGASRDLYLARDSSSSYDAEQAHDDAPQPHEPDFSADRISSRDKSSPDSKKGFQTIGGIIGGIIALGIVAYFIYDRFGGTTSKLESTIKEGMQTQFGIQTKSVTLEKQPDGKYKGIAVDANGEEWDIINVVVEGNQVKWFQRPPKSHMERQFRETVRGLLNVQLQTIDISKQPDGSYRGSGVTDSGIKFDLHETLMAGSTNSLLVANPNPGSYEPWIRQNFESTLKTKIKSIKLDSPRADGNVHGIIVDADGSKYDLRIGHPPGEKWNLNDPNMPKPISYKAALSPDSYPDLAKSGIEKEFKVKIKSIHLEMNRSGFHEGIAESTTGKKYQVEVGDLPEIEQPKHAPGLLDFKQFQQPNFDEILRLAQQPMPNFPMLNGPVVHLNRVNEGKWEDLGPDVVKWRAKPLP
jgi:hypothetical protein